MGNSSSLIENPKDLIKNGQIDLVLDVRSLNERKQGYYNPSYHIPLDLLEQAFPKKFLDKNIRVLVYCRTGNRASQAVEILKNLGYNNVYYTTLNYSELAK